MLSICVTPILREAQVGEVHAKSAGQQEGNVKEGQNCKTGQGTSFYRLIFIEYKKGIEAQAMFKHVVSPRAIMSSTIMCDETTPK
jgi:hypothetical protein